MPCSSRRMRRGDITGWASLNPYSHRCAYAGVADLSVYVARDARGTGVGSLLLRALEKTAKAHEFHKIVLFTFTFNAGGQGLYRKLGYREVGTFHEMGKLDGRFVDVMAMEKTLVPFVLFVCRHNTGRSQMAEAYLRHFAGDRVEVASAGTIAADEPHQGVVAAMAEDGIDISAARPKLLDPAVAAARGPRHHDGLRRRGRGARRRRLGLAGSERSAARTRARDPRRGQGEGRGAGAFADGLGTSSKVPSAGRPLPSPLSQMRQPPARASLRT